MELMNFSAKDFKTRAGLEKQVMVVFGLTPSKKKAFIRGTKEELNNLSLSDGKIFWGINCVGVEEIKKPAKKVDRGKRTGYGLNNKDTKVKDKLKIKKKKNA